MHEERKADHIRINLEQDVQHGLSTGLENYHFLHNALPEIDFAQIDTNVNFLDKTLKSPLLISSMTGGTDEATQINRILAMAAETRGIAMGLGSQRVALVSGDGLESFKITRRHAPNALLMANLGAVQLNYGFGLEHCQKAVDMLEANALILHLNSLQEAVQPEGDTNFSNLLPKIEAICSKLSVPVIVKEVGWGFSRETVHSLANVGVYAVDVAGAGGTSWTQVEMYRTQTKAQRRIAATFRSWGIPTSEAIMQACTVNIPVIASGGLRNGLDLAKSIALGATLGGMAGPFLKAAVDSLEAVIEEIDITTTELKVAMFGIGANSLQKLRETDRFIKKT